MFQNNHKRKTPATVMIVTMMNFLIGEPRKYHDAVWPARDLLPVQDALIGIFPSVSCLSLNGGAAAEKLGLYMFIH